MVSFSVAFVSAVNLSSEEDEWRVAAVMCMLLVLFFLQILGKNKPGQEQYSHPEECFWQELIFF